MDLLSVILGELCSMDTLQDHPRVSTIHLHLYHLYHLLCLALANFHSSCLVLLGVLLDVVPSSLCGSLFLNFMIISFIDLSICVRASLRISSILALSWLNNLPLTPSSTATILKVGHIIYVGSTSLVLYVKYKGDKLLKCFTIVWYA